LTFEKRLDVVLVSRDRKRDEDSKAADMNYRADFAYFCLYSIAALQGHCGFHFGPEPRRAQDNYQTAQSNPGSARVRNCRGRMTRRSLIVTVDPLKNTIESVLWRGSGYNGCSRFATANT
jgi:hypothetical protein